MEAPPVIAPPRPRFPWLIAGALALVAAAAGAVLFTFDPSHCPFYPRCFLYTTTGILCPGCGSQRALYYLLHGQVGLALRCNAILVLGLPFVLFKSAQFTRRWMASGVMPDVNFPARWIKLVVGGIVVFTFLRNIPCAPFIYLAPP